LLQPGVRNNSASGVPTEVTLKYRLNSIGYENTESRQDVQYARLPCATHASCNQMRNEPGVIPDNKKGPEGPFLFD
jgi:hypothetical protein